jgi:hypothetical protein
LIVATSKESKTDGAAGNAIPAISDETAGTCEASKHDHGYLRRGNIHQRNAQGQPAAETGRDILKENDARSCCGFCGRITRYGQLMYAARTRNGFTPASPIEIFKKLKPLKTKNCPFANLPEKKAGRWGAGGENGGVSLAHSRAGRAV